MKRTEPSRGSSLGHHPALRVSQALGPPLQSSVSQALGPPQSSVSQALAPLPPGPQGHGLHRVAGHAVHFQKLGCQFCELGRVFRQRGAPSWAPHGPAEGTQFCEAGPRGSGASQVCEPADGWERDGAGRNFAPVLASRQKCMSLRPGEGDRQTDFRLLTSAQVGAARRPGQGGPTVGRHPHASHSCDPGLCAGSQEASRYVALTPAARGCRIPHSRSAESLALTSSKPPRVAKPASPPQSC